MASEMDFAQLKKNLRLSQGVAVFSLLCIPVYFVVAWYYAGSYRGGPESERVSEFVTFVVYIIVLSGVFAARTIESIMRVSIYRKTQDAASAIMTGRIVTIVLCEMVAIGGLVLTVLTFDAKHFYLLALFAILAIGVFFPRWKEWRQLYEQLHQ